MLNKLHKELGYIAIAISIPVFIRIFQLMYISGNTGRVQVGGTIAFFGSIPSIIFLVIQLFILKKILKEDKIGLKNLALFLIFYFFFIALFNALETNKFFFASSICLLVSIIGFYTSAIYNKRIFFWLFALISIINIILIIW